MKIDFFARRVHFIDHMAPVWKELCAEARGRFFVPESIIGHAVMRGVDAVALKARSGNAMDVILPHPALSRGERSDAVMVCAYGDLAVVNRVDPTRKMVFMEHGVGLTPAIGHPGYAGGRGGRGKVSLFLAPNECIREKTKKALPGVDQVVIGTPKLDPWSPHSLTLPSPEGRGVLAREKAVVCISFHWNGEKVSPEAGNAFAHYKSVLPQLTRNKYFTLIGHGHPRAMEYFAKIYEELGVEVVRDFDEVLERANVYVNDCSSTAYEFCVTGKPVVLLNAPWFRKNVHTGIRFWDWADIGPQVEKPETLAHEIERMLWWPASYAERRRKMVRELYPFLGESAKRAARAIEQWLSKNGDHNGQT